MVVESFWGASKPAIVPTKTQWPDSLLESKAGTRRTIIPAWTDHLLMVSKFPRIF